MNGGGGIGPPTQTGSGTVEHGVIFGARVGLEAQFLVLARAYMSSQDTAAYGTDVGCGTDVGFLPRAVKCLNECGVRVQWQHIDQAGIHGVTLDQDAAAIKGTAKSVPPPGVLRRHVCTSQYEDY
ncbi:hypothetical protein E4U51_002833 [Claviceps purpurea]|nr:hypothetical protein E4U51_002833 [Claviceps purpurea]